MGNDFEDRKRRLVKREKRSGRKAVVPPPLEDSVSPEPAAGSKSWLLPAIFLVIALALFLVWFLREETPEIPWKVVTSYPHATEGAYTQGLEIVDGRLFESTGFLRESDWRIVDMETGKVVPPHRYGISSTLFGEGITVWKKKRLYQLTWQDQKGLIWDVEPVFEEESKKARRIGEFKYRGEGWGLTHDGERLIMSSGSGEGLIEFRDPENPETVLGSLTVPENGKPVKKLNELEHFRGYLWANVFETWRIVKIDIETGKVVGYLNLETILTEEEKAKLDRGHVLNGIAYDKDTDKIYVTGKNWPKLFEIAIDE